MKHHPLLRFACQAAFIVSIIPAGWVIAQEKPADNTAKNKTVDGKPSADKQGLNSSDTETTRKIRKSVMADKSLSTYAHNVKIITANGMVTLKGPVRTEEEKAAVEKAAVDVVGKANVSNEITIAPKKENN